MAKKSATRNTAVQLVNQTALVATVLKSFGTSYTTPVSIEKGIRKICGMDKPNVGIAKTVFDNVNLLLTTSNLKTISFDTLKPVLYNMIHRRAGEKGVSTAHTRFNTYQRLVKDRFKVIGQPVIEPVVETKPEPTAGIMKVTKVEPSNMYQHLVSQGVPEHIAVAHIANSFGK